MIPLAEYKNTCWLTNDKGKGIVSYFNVQFLVSSNNELLYIRQPFMTFLYIIDLDC